MIWRILIYLDKNLRRSWLKKLVPNKNQNQFSLVYSKENQHSHSLQGFFFSRAAAARSKNLPGSVSSTESGNSQSRNILTHTSCNKRFISSKGVPKLSTGELSLIFFRKLGESYKWLPHFELVKGYQIPFLSVSIQKSPPPSLPPTYFNDPSGKKI